MTLLQQWDGSNLWDVIQKGFVESLYSVGMHLYTICNELNEVGHRVVTDVTPRL